MKNNHMIDELDLLYFGKPKPKNPGFWDWIAIVAFFVIFGWMLVIVGNELMEWRLINVGDSMVMWVRK